MAERFRFRIFSSADQQAQYDAIPKKDSMTFYLLSQGKAYLGDVKLFDVNDTVEISQLVHDMLDEGFSASEKTVASTQAIVDYVSSQMNNLATVLTNFFVTNVKSHVLTEHDLTNEKISLPVGSNVGDVGLLFTMDTDNKDGGETYVFISLEKLFLPVESDTIKMSLSEDNELMAELKIKEDEKTVKVDKDGIYLDKVKQVDEIIPSNVKLVTEESLVRYIMDVILPRVDESIEEVCRDMVVATIDPDNKVVAIGDDIYVSLAEAIANMPSGETIKLVDDTASEGISVNEGTNITIDLAGYALIMEAPGAGSPGTRTNGFQFLKDSNITIKNGYIVAEDAKIVIQNYSNLTLDNVIVKGRGINKYVLSNNYGNIVLKNNTKIIAQEGMVAFDLFYGMASVYDGGVSVTIEDDSVIVEGVVEYSKSERATEEAFARNCRLTTPYGYKLNIPAGYEWMDNKDGTQTLIKSATPS